MKIKKEFFLSKPSLIILASLLFFALSFLPSFEMIERQLLDLSFRVRGAEKPHSDIVIVEIDDASISLVGSWPWPRSIHAAMLNMLRANKPAAIFFDVIFSEKSTLQNDIALSHEMKELGVVVLPYYFPSTSRDHIIFDQQGLPIPKILESSNKLGFVNAFVDRDGHAREMPLVLRNGNESYTHISVALESIQHDLSSEEIEKYYRMSPILINFPGPYQDFRRISFYNILTSLNTPYGDSLIKSLENKMVLIGHTATATAMDLKASPYSPQYPGVGIQASLLHTLLTKKFIRRLPHGFVLFLLLVTAWIVLTTTQRNSPIKGLLYTFAIMLITFLLAMIAFKYYRIWVPIFTVLLISPILYTSMTLIDFLKAQLEKELMTRELTLASRIQENFLPKDLPEIPSIEIAAVSIPAKHVGGDLYDVLKLKEGKWGVCVGDVSGKGVPAALFMAKAIGEFRREADSLDTAEVISRLNDKLALDGASGLFITVLYLILDPEKSNFTYSNGGHEPILHYQKKSGKVELLKTQTGMPLGIMPDGEFDKKEQIWEPGDVLMLQSDGVKEAMNPKREIFGFERAQNALAEVADKNVDEIIKHVQKRILEFAGTAPQHDDTTIVCIKHL